MQSGAFECITWEATWCISESAPGTYFTHVDLIENPMLWANVSYPNLMNFVANPMVWADFSYPDLMQSVANPVVWADFSYPDRMQSVAIPVVWADFSYTNLMNSVANPMLWANVPYPPLMKSIANPIGWAEVPNPTFPEFGWEVSIDLLKKIGLQQVPTSDLCGRLWGYCYELGITSDLKMITRGKEENAKTRKVKVKCQNKVLEIHEVPLKSYPILTLANANIYTYIYIYIYIQYVCKHDYTVKPNTVSQCTIDFVQK